MTNIYFGWLGGAAPSGYQKLTGYDGKYIRCTATVGAVFSTGGSETHEHAIINFSVGNSGSGSYHYGGYPGSSTYVSVSYNHKDHSLSASSGLTGNNTPSYFTFELIYMDLDDWEANERRIPAGAVVLSDVVQALSSLTRHAESDNRLWKIGTAGSYADKTTDTHSSIKVTLGNGGGLVSVHTGRHPGGRGSFSYIGTHGHVESGAIASSAHSIMPKRVTTRSYSASVTTDRAPAGIIAFFDGTPSANWAIMSSWVEHFICGANADASLTGTSSHGQTGVTGTSGAKSGSTNTALGDDFVYDEIYPVIAHTHSVAFDLSTVSHEPVYVNLILAKLNTTLYHINQGSKTVSLTTLLKKTLSGDQKFSTRLRADKTVQVDLEAPIIGEVSKEHGAETSLAILDNPVEYDLTSRVKVRRSVLVLASTRLTRNYASYSMSSRFIRPYVVPPPVVDTLYQSYIDQLVFIEQQIQKLDWANKIDSAVGSELWTKWGRVYDLPRYAGETDEEYRMRLKVYLKCYSGSGTEQVCEEVLDFLVGKVGATSVESLWPATAVVNFSDAESIAKAQDMQWLIEDSLEKMLAAGISYVLYLPLHRYSMEMSIRGPNTVDYDLASSVIDLKSKTFDMSTFLTSVGSLDYDTSSSLMLTRGYSHRLASRLIKLRNMKQFSLSSRVKAIGAADFSLTYSSEIHRSKTIGLGAKVMKQRLSRSVTLSSVLEKRRKHPYGLTSYHKAIGNCEFGLSCKVVEA